MRPLGRLIQGCIYCIAHELGIVRREIPVGLPEISELSLCGYDLVWVTECCSQDADEASYVVKINAIIGDMGRYLVKGTVF